MADQLTRPERLQIMLDPEELRAIDDFRFRRRMPSRAATVRELPLPGAIDSRRRGLSLREMKVGRTGASGGDWNPERGGCLD